MSNRRLTIAILWAVLLSLGVINVKCEENVKALRAPRQDVGVGRTMGQHILRRMAFVFLPIMFTLGVMTTLLAGLIVISLKNLGIGIALLVVGISQVIGRLFGGFSLPSPPPPYPVVHYAHSRSDSVAGSRNPAFASPWPEKERLSSYDPYARDDV